MTRMLTLDDARRELVAEIETVAAALSRAEEVGQGITAAGLLETLDWLGAAATGHEDDFQRWCRERDLIVTVHRCPGCGGTLLQTCEHIEQHAGTITLVAHWWCTNCGTHWSTARRLT